MKFQIPNIHHSKVNTHTHTHTHTQTDRQTDRQAESNMPFQLFQSWGHNYHGEMFCLIKVNESIWNTKHKLDTETCSCGHFGGARKKL